MGLYALAAAAKLPLESTVRDSTSVLLTRPLDEFPAGLDATWRLMRWRLYGTGAALGLILNRLHVPWRHKVQRGAGLDELLDTAIRGSQESKAEKLLHGDSGGTAAKTNVMFTPKTPRSRHSFRSGFLPAMLYRHIR